MQDEAEAAAGAVPAAEPEPAASAAATESEEPVGEESAAEEPAAADSIDEPAPAAEAAADPLSSAEPPRRWIDATGRYAVVGTLLAVRETAIEIRRLDGCTVSVPASRLSPHDQDYVRQAADRLLSGRTTPRATDTAGM
jgi:hypothetical protein